MLVVDRDGNQEDSSSSANKGMMVSEAQANYILFGASAERRKERVRPPKESEPRDPSWAPLPEALAIVEQRK